MSLIKYDPFREMQNMRDRMNEWFIPFGDPSVFWNNKAFSPSCDLEETENEIVVKMDVPGINEQDINLTLSGDNLIVKGVRKAEKDEKKKHFHRMERFYGTFERVISLPLTVEKDKISAEYIKGVLEVHLPKVPEVKPKEIQIKVK